MKSLVFTLIGLFVICLTLPESQARIFRRGQTTEVSYPTATTICTDGNCSTVIPVPTLVPSPTITFYDPVPVFVEPSYQTTTVTEQVINPSPMTIVTKEVTRTRPSRRFFRSRHAVRVTSR